MTTLAHEYFQVHALPNLEAWLAQSTDIRLAMNAVVSMYHMADHYWHAYSVLEPSRVLSKNTSSAFRSELATSNSHFKILRDVAEAHKHMELDRSSRVVSNASQTAVGATAFGESDYGTGPYGGGPSIIIKLDSGTKHHLSYLVGEVKQLWQSMLT